MNTTTYGVSDFFVKYGVIDRVGELSSQTPLNSSFVNCWNHILNSNRTHLKANEIVITRKHSVRVVFKHWSGTCPSFKPEKRTLDGRFQLLSPKRVSEEGMFSSLKLQASTPATHRRNNYKVAGNLTFSPSTASSLRLPPRRFSVLSVKSSENVPSSQPSISSDFTSSVGSPSLHLSHSTLSQRHISVLNFLACAVSLLSLHILFIYFDIIILNSHNLNIWEIRV